MIASYPVVSSRFNKIKRAVEPILEALESRVLFSSSLGADGTLSILGTEAADNIIISLNKDNPDLLQVNEADPLGNPSFTYYNASDVLAIEVQAFGGPDRITINEAKGAIAVPTRLFGGWGRDTIIGGSGRDVIYGEEGMDLLMGRDKADQIYGGLKQDRILGENGLDSLFGGGGHDIINTGLGTDFVDGGLGNNAIDQGSANAYRPLSQMGQPLTTPPSQPGNPLIFNPTIFGYTPSQMRTAYEFGDLSDANFTNRGAGQTIAIVNAFHSNTVLQDLTVFSQAFGLPAPSGVNFQQVFASGNTPAVEEGWAGEIALDVQWAHAIAPEAKIILVEADTNFEFDLMIAFRKAAELVNANGGGVISLSLGRDLVNDGLPVSDLDDELRNLVQQYPNISWVVASGDTGGVASFPAISGLVTAVGGTFLPLDTEGNLVNQEVAWSGGGGGVDIAEPIPGYQRGVLLGGTTPLETFGGRVTPDVAYNADPASGVAIFNTTPSDSFTGWQAAGGTSAGAPQFAGLVALANEMRQRTGQGVLGSALNETLYSLARTSKRQEIFRDIVAGTNPNEALPGYDMATGWGTPLATRMIAELSSTNVQYLSVDIEWSARLQRLPVGGVLGGAASIGLLTYNSGTGFATGGTNISLQLLSTTDTIFTPLPIIGAGDSLVPSITGIQLFRRADNTVYGFGFATAVITTPTNPIGIPVILENGGLLSFEAFITMDANGVEHISGEFYSVDRFGSRVNMGFDEFGLPINAFSGEFSG